MDRPPRCKKTVNYSDFMDDSDDEDFATAPPNKKTRPTQHVKTEKETSDVRVKERKERVSLDERTYTRDLESALALSLLQSSENTEPEKSLSCEDLPPVLTHFTENDSCSDVEPNQPTEDLPPMLSNCSVDVTCLGLDKITSELPSSPASCKQRKSQKATSQQRRVLAEINDSREDEDYKPQNTPESDSELSDQDESEDDEFTVKKKGGKKKTSKNEKQRSNKSAMKEKNPMKPAKAKSQPTVKNKALSPTVAHSVPALRQTPTTPPMNKTSSHASPAGGKLPKWTPPGLVNRSASSSQSPPVKSPGLGLRLGLSRLARVKPLHPNAVGH